MKTLLVLFSPLIAALASIFGAFGAVIWVFLYYFFIMMIGGFLVALGMYIFS
jgi:hypothetical protein